MPPYNSPEGSRELRNELNKAADEIQKEKPLISLKDLVAKVKEKTGKGSESTLRARYNHNRR